MPEMTQNASPNKSKHRKKNRESHNEVERHRKKKINSGINRIGDLIPCSPALKQSKNMILDQAFKYITELKRQNDELLLNGGNSEQACEIKKLRRELAEIQKENARYIELLKSNDICLYDDPTLTWKGNARNSKAPLIAAVDQTPKLPLCLNGNQLGPSNQGAAVHGITFNVGHNLQKQTANVVPVQRTCNLVTPITISGVYPLDKTWQQNSTSPPTTAAEVESASLPVTIAQTTANLTLSNSQDIAPSPSSSALSCPLATGAAAAGNDVEQNVHENAVSVSSNLLSQGGVPGICLQVSTNAPGKTSAASRCAETGKDILPGVDIASSIAVVIHSREKNSSVEVSAGTSASMLSAPSLEAGWSLSSGLPASIGSLSRILSDGNTQTTWTTLQLAGNTVQPLSQASSALISTPVAEQPVASKETSNHRPVTACINLNRSPSEIKPMEQIMVKLPSCQPVQVQSLITQPQAQSTTGILPLHPPVQVIQVAQPFGPAINPSPANQNIILLQPPAPAPCPPIPKPPVGQQIVIIQATSNQNTLPIMASQPAPSVVMPINATSPVVCPSNPVQSAVIPQTFGGKHLVHILPRPSPVQPSSTAQQVPASATAAPNQQPPTISLNGQLFALQPMNPSSASSNQTPMQIIQPTTSEDPNTNVALNTFGALANLSQNISQLAGHNCLQFTLNPPAAATSAAPVNCVSVSGTAMTASVAETSSALPVASVMTKPLSVKPVTTSTSAKPKKTIKKPMVKKGASAKKDPAVTTKPEPLKVQSSNEPPLEREKASDLVTSSTIEEKAGGQSSEKGPSEKPDDIRNRPSSEGDTTSSDPRHEELLPAHFQNPAEEDAGAQNTRKPDPECFTGDVDSGNRPVILETLQEAPVAEVSQESNNLTPGRSSDRSTAFRPCQGECGTPTLTAADLLEAQILIDDPNDKTFTSKGDLKDLDSQGPPFRKVKDKEPVTGGETRPEPVIPNPNQTVSSEQDGGSNVSAINRQTDSPSSGGSASSRNFSVASMLPDANRDDVVGGGASLGPTFNGCGFSEQNDIVAVAARAIFDQETLSKVRSRVQAEVRGPVPRSSEAEALSPDCQLSFKPHVAKENLSRLQASSHSFTALDPNGRPCADRLVEKSNCAIVNAASLSLQISTSQSQNVTSLSINNLIHPGGVNHSVNCASVLQTSEHMSIPPSTNTSVSSSSYESQTEVTTVLSDYSHEQQHTMSSALMQVSRATVPLLKQTLDAGKESNKRSAHEDGILSAAKRQKQCLVPIRLDRLQPLGSVTEQNEVMVGHVVTDSSTSAVSVSSGVQSHGEGLSNLLTSNNNFINPTLRQSDLRCNSQPSVSEQGQIGNQHLQPLQPHQQQVPLHSNNPYLKQQQQQAAHLRDHHHLYQQQQQVPHVDRSLRAQSHNIQQQRMVQQDVQMQKKQNPVHGAQTARLSLQQKHLTEQNRHKSSQPHHQQIQQQQQIPHFGNAQAEKPCENSAPSRGLHVAHSHAHMNQDMLHQHQQDISRSQGSIVTSEHLSGHNQVQRLMTSRSLEQQMASQSSVVSRPPNMTCVPHRQERNRVSSYSAEALIGKSTSNTEPRIGVSVQASRVSEQIEMRKYLDVSRNKVLPSHNLQGHMSIEHSISAESQRLPDCQTFKPGGLSQQQQAASFEVQTSRNNEGGTNANMRGLQSQTYRISQNPNSAMDRQKHLPYHSVQEMPIANALPMRENENSCHQSFMQSLLAPHIGDQIGSSQRSISSHQRMQYNASSSIEFSCPPARESLHLRRENEGQNRESCDLVMGQVNSRNNSLNIPFSSSSGEIQGRNTSPHMQKSVRPTDGQTKNQLNIQVSINMHGVVHPPIPHQSISHGNGDQRQTVRQTNHSVSQRSRHPLQEEPDAKTRQPERNRSGNQRHGNMFDSALPHLPLAGPSSMILGRQQPVTEKRTGIVRFMPDSSQVSADNPNPDQHTLAQNFGFPFIPEGTMNPPINANASFIPPVTQTTATRTPALIPVDPQNTLPSFYPPYSPAHPSLSNDLTLPYFSNQMFPNPSTEKPNGNRFGSILSPPRPVGFSQTTFPLLPEMPPMHMANPSHLSNFNLTSLFPEIATALPADGSAVSPLLSISHPSASDSKQTSNRPAHNISHILGHDSSSAV